MHSAHAACTKKLNSETVEATEHAVVAAEFTIAVGGYASALEPYELLEECIALWPPLEEWVVLVIISLGTRERAKKRTRAVNGPFEISSSVPSSSKPSWSKFLISVSRKSGCKRGSEASKG